MVFAGAFALIWLVVRCFYLLRRARMRESARAAAAALGLVRADSGDARVELYQGASMDCHLYVATCAAVSPGPRFEYQEIPAVTLLVVAPGLLPPGLGATTTHLAPKDFETGALEFDQWFKLTARDVAAGRRFFDSAELRDALLRCFGARKDGSGSGILIDVSGDTLRVHHMEPKPPHAVEVARAALAAAVKLRQRSAFVQ